MQANAGDGAFKEIHPSRVLGNSVSPNAGRRGEKTWKRTGRGNSGGSLWLSPESGMGQQQGCTLLTEEHVFTCLSHRDSEDCG